MLLASQGITTTDIDNCGYNWTRTLLKVKCEILSLNAPTLSSTNLNDVPCKHGIMQERYVYNSYDWHLIWHTALATALKPSSDDLWNKPPNNLLQTLSQDKKTNIMIQKTNIMIHVQHLLLLDILDFESFQYNEKNVKEYFSRNVALLSALIFTTDCACHLGVYLFFLILVIWLVNGSPCPKQSSSTHTWVSKCF